MQVVWLCGKGSATSTQATFLWRRERFSILELIPYSWCCVVGKTSLCQYHRSPPANLAEALQPVEFYAGCV